jgi:hypothetical protein
VSNMIVFNPLPMAAVTSPAGYTGGDNLLTPDPKEVAVTMLGPGVGSFDIDMGAAVTIDTLLLGGLSAGNYLYAFASATGMGTGITTLAFPGGPTNAAPYGFLKLAQPVTSRYFRIQAGTSVALFTLGVIALGLSFQPTHNREWGGGRLLIDTGSKERLLGGGFGIGRGVRKAAYRWTFGDLLDAELDALWNLALDRGETSAIVVVEDPAETVGLGNRIHYGLFDRFEAFERQNPSQTRWALSVEDWV